MEYPTNHLNVFITIRTQSQMSAVKGTADSWMAYIDSLVHCRDPYIHCMISGILHKEDNYWKGYSRRSNFSCFQRASLCFPARRRPLETRQFAPSRVALSGREANTILKESPPLKVYLFSLTHSSLHFWSGQFNAWIAISPSIQKSCCM